MPESEEHSNLVLMLRSYIADRFCDGKTVRIFTDSTNSESSMRPPSIAGYVPDAYVVLKELGAVVIGEAKSLKDLENSHTEAQVTAFLRRCAMVQGSTFILAVPWPVERLARALLSSLQVRAGLSCVDTVVMSEVDGLDTAAKSGRVAHCRS